MFETIPFHCSAHPLPCAMIFWFGLWLIYFQSKAKNHSRPFTAFWEDFHISSGNSTNSIAEQTTCQIAFPNGHKFWTHILSQQCQSFFTQPWHWPLGCGKLKPEKAIWGESCWVCLSVRTETHTHTDTQIQLCCATWAHDLKKDFCISETVLIGWISVERYSCVLYFDPAGIHRDAPSQCERTLREPLKPHRLH